MLSEIHYCVLCHEREKDTCSKGFAKGRKVTANPLGIPMIGCPLDEKILGDALVRKRGDAPRRLAIVSDRQPDVPGHRYRICNDCMRPALPEEETVNIPQTETGVLTDV